MEDRDDIDAQIEARRRDPEFERRLEEAMERNREALELLAKGDEEQEDQ